MYAGVLPAQNAYKTRERVQYTRNACRTRVVTRGLRQRFKERHMRRSLY